LPALRAASRRQAARQYTAVTAVGRHRRDQPPRLLRPLQGHAVPARAGVYVGRAAVRHLRAESPAGGGVLLESFWLSAILGRMRRAESLRLRPQPVAHALQRAASSLTRRKLRSSGRPQECGRPRVASRRVSTRHAESVRYGGARANELVLYVQYAAPDPS